MEFARQQYMQKLISRMNNGRVKIITGLRRCGKSYLLFELFVKYLRESGVEDERIIRLALDELSNMKYRNPVELDKYIRERIKDQSMRYYILLDEIQFVTDIKNPYTGGGDAEITFVDVVIGLMKIKNADVYITGSNSKMLSADVLTQFRDRGDEIRVYPLSFAEFCEKYEGDKRSAWADYCTYGGMPVIPALQTHEEKSRYLRDLFRLTYLKDVLERYHVRNGAETLDDLLNVVASSAGSLTNPSKLANTFLSAKKIRVSSTTLEQYLGYFTEAFLIHRVQRYDVKGKKYLQTPLKYYFTDVGLRNAKLGFRQQEENHIMENVLCCELIRSGYDVDVGVAEQHLRADDGRKIRKQLEIDFVVNRGWQRYYIQSALTVADPEKREQETASLLHIPDSFAKIVVVRDYINPWRDERGILYIGVEQFLLDEEAIRL